MQWALAAWHAEAAQAALCVLRMLRAPSAATAQLWCWLTVSMRPCRCCGCCLLPLCYGRSRASCLGWSRWLARPLARIEVAVQRSCAFHHPLAGAGLAVLVKRGHTADEGAGAHFRMIVIQETTKQHITWQAACGGTASTELNQVWGAHHSARQCRAPAPLVPGVHFCEGVAMRCPGIKNMVAAELCSCLGALHMHAVVL